jgi:hypothetical protein
MRDHSKNPDIASLIRATIYDHGYSFSFSRLTSPEFYKFVPPQK